MAMNVYILHITFTSKALFTIERYSWFQPVSEQRRIAAGRLLSYA